MDSCSIVTEAYTSTAVPVSDVNFDHKWFGVTSPEAKEKWLKLLRHHDVAKFGDTQVSWFLETQGPSLVYPMSLFGYFLGFALRSVEGKVARIYTRHKNSSCYSSFAAVAQPLPKKPTVFISEGYADCEAIAHFHPWSVATLGGAMKMAIVPVVAALAGRVVSMTDNDDPGEHYFHSMTKRFAECGKKLERLRYPKTFNDPDDWFRADPQRMRKRIERFA